MFGRLRYAFGVFAVVLFAIAAGGIFGLADAGSPSASRPRSAHRARRRLRAQRRRPHERREGPPRARRAARRSRGLRLRPHLRAVLTTGRRPPRLLADGDRDRRWRRGAASAREQCVIGGIALRTALTMFLLPACSVRFSRATSTCPMTDAFAPLDGPPAGALTAWCTRARKAGRHHPFAATSIFRLRLR